MVWSLLPDCAHTVSMTPSNTEPHWAIDHAARIIGECRGHTTPYDSDREIANALAEAGLLADEYMEPCRQCGRTDMPLHVDYLCPECHVLGAF